MNGKLKIGLVIAAMLALGAIGAGLFIESGYYNIGADDHHTKIVLAIIEQLRARSIGARTSTIDLRYAQTRHQDERHARVGQETG